MPNQTKPNQNLWAVTVEREFHEGLLCVCVCNKCTPFSLRSPYAACWTIAVGLNNNAPFQVSFSFLQTPSFSLSFIQWENTTLIQAFSPL